MTEDTQALHAEIERLQKIVRSLTDRAERSTNVQDTEFSLFQTTVMLSDQVQARTAELEALLRERERLHQALRESEAKYHALVDQSLVGIAILEAGRFSFGNPRLCEIFGVRPEVITALRLEDLVIAEDRALAAAMTSDAAAAHAVLRCHRPDGGQIVVEIFGNAAHLQGRAVQISVVLDITERDRVEREVAALQEQLRQQSLQDPLTGLNNRRYLDIALPREIELAGRMHFPLSVIIGDLDLFKVINDTHGHPVGDLVLQAFAALLKRSARSSDVVCRYGGEEFLLLLPGMTQHDALHRAEQLRQALAGLQGVYGAHRITITASFGVASFPQDATDPVGLIERADQALYRAKKGGRNRVEGWGAPALALPR